MATFVQKFGGSSLADLSCIKKVAKLVVQKRREHKVIVVVSAMHGETDRLNNMASKLINKHKRLGPAMDTLLASGEQVSASLLALAIEDLGYPSRVLTGAQAGLLTDDVSQKARIKRVETSYLQSILDKGLLPVVMGFQGVGSSGQITTIGRGGSDTTAVVLASALSVDECEIYTDVQGVFTADPHVVSDARLLSRITFEEMLELSSLGAKVLQRRAVVYASQHNLPLRVLSTFKPGPGTLITYEDPSVEQALVSGITFDRDQALITLLGIDNQAGSLHRLFAALNKGGVELGMVVQNASEQSERMNLSMTFSKDDVVHAKNIIEHEIKNFFKSARLTVNTKLAKLSLVGLGMRAHPAVTQRVFQVLADHGINIEWISTSELRLSVLIDERYLELGARLLHQTFALAEPLLKAKKNMIRE
jgi:aspartate kinase